LSRHATPHPPAARAPTPARAAAEAGDGWPAPRGRRLALAAAGRADLAAVREHVDAACAAAGADAATRDALVLAADEVCANVLAHAYGDAAGPLTVDVAAAGRDAGRVARVTVVDAGPAFDPRALAAADPVAPDTVAARPAGGFGVAARVPLGRRRGLRARRPAQRADARTPPGPRPHPSRLRAARMHISIVHERDVTVVAVAGSLDALTADALTGALQAEVRAGRTRLVASFAELEYTSSAGLRVLLATLKDARQQGGDLRVAAMRDRVRRVLDLSGFTSILKCYPDVASAVASFPPAGAPAAGARAAAGA
jgi:anti-anti-sigma factor